MLAFAGAALFALALLDANAQAASLTFGGCSAVQVFVPSAGLQCATLTVPIDRGDLALGNIGLAVQRVPAKGPRQGTIVLLAGGPGQPALPAFEELLAPLARELQLRDFELVAFDQRGTGQSDALQCPGVGVALEGGLSSYLGACGTALGSARAFYSSQESVEDLVALREGLGEGPLSLFAVSYGTRVAGMYAREDPGGVARMVLDSPVPTTGTPDLNSQRLRALPRVLDEGICGVGACRSFSSNVYADLARVVAKLRRHSLRTHIYDSQGQLVPASVTETGVLRLLVGLDLSLGTHEFAPAAIAAAAHGDAGPLARLTHGLQTEVPASAVPFPPPRTDSLGGASPAAGAPESASATSLALFAATYCVENELPWSPDSPPAGRAATLRDWLAALPASTTAPFAPATVAAASSDLSACMDWPATPAAPPSPVGLSATPTLILSGDDDLRTPYEQSLTVAAGYSDGQLLRIPDAGHSTVSSDRTGCAERATIEFLASGHAPVSCPALNEPQALPLPPASLTQVRPVSARSHVVGQVAAAAALTIEDLYAQTGTSGGGLRGGYWELRGRYTIVHDLVDVSGVAISGSILPEGTAHFTVHGRLTGTLTQKGLIVTGHLNGALVHLHLVAT